MSDSSTDLLLDLGLVAVIAILCVLFRGKLIRSHRARMIEYTLPLLAK